MFDVPEKVFPTANERARVLVVDDEETNRKLLTRLLSRDYSVETAPDGEEALALLERIDVDLVLLDVRLPGLDGFEVCARLKRLPRTRLVPVVLVTGLGAREHRIRGIHVGADDFLTKPFDAEELHARVASLVRLKEYTDDLESAEAILKSLALTIDARDPYTDGHCERLSKFAVALGTSLGLSKDELSALDRGGYLHDIGKIGIPDAVLLKPTKLTTQEFELIKQHTIIGDRLCGELRSLRLVRKIVRHHHEALDGSGYPDGLSGDQVPLLAQIVSIVDLYDAVTTSRPYRDALPPEHAYAELRSECARGRRNPRLVEAFISLSQGGR
ncbi:MAG TPA: HD domain-containing phosphohydrolase [Vicinamibacterales bacterium]|nr:HD domain-containing phosphohydrolase [Vicinamibacterales bacterium]